MSANQVYDAFLGERGSVSYNEAPLVEYPDKDQQLTFGTVYLPRVYGLDLTAFEIASSGIVAMTLNDVHSLDFSRNDTLSNVYITTLCNDTLILGLGSSNVTIELDGDNNSLNVWAANDVVVAAADSNLMMTMDNGLDQIVFATPSGDTLTMGSNLFSVNADDTRIAGSLDVQGMEILLSASSNVTISGDSSNLQYVQDAVRNDHVFYVDGVERVSLGASNLTITIDNLTANTESTTINADSNITLSGDAGNVVYVIDATSNQHIFSVADNDTLIVNQSNVVINGDLELTGSLSVDGDDMNISARSNIYLGANSNLDYHMISSSNTHYFKVFDSNIMTIDPNSVDITNVALNLQGTLNAYTDNSTISASNDLVLKGGDTTLITGSNNLKLQSWPVEYEQDPTVPAHFFSLYDVNVLTITNSNVRIDGNLVVTGVIDSMTVQETTMYVQDKLINLAATSNNLLDGSYENDGTINDGAGINVYGIPAAFASNTATASNFEKSIRWQYGPAGVEGLGSTHADTEPFWHVKGGALRMTHTKTDSFGSNVGEVSFSFRINQNDELELVKFYDLNGTPQVRRVAKFGLTLPNL